MVCWRPAADHANTKNIKTEEVAPAVAVIGSGGVGSASVGKGRNKRKARPSAQSRGSGGSASGGSTSNSLRKGGKRASQAASDDVAVLEAEDQAAVEGDKTEPRASVAIKCEQK